MIEGSKEITIWSLSSTARKSHERTGLVVRDGWGVLAAIAEDRANEVGVWTAALVVGYDEVVHS